MGNIFQPLPSANVRLLPSQFLDRTNLNRCYVMELRNDHLLQNYYLEAGLWSPRHREGLAQMHGGWETPTCQLRGHFLGHWLSAAARLSAATGDAEAKAKADAVVAELARCQEENGGEWAGPIPEKYLDWTARGKHVWAPHYTLHKTLMGLQEMHSLTGNEQALDVLLRWARWFERWTNRFSRSQLDDILDVETGGMLEIWANLYELTGDPLHLELMRRYDRPRLFDRLLAGEEVLSNMHANTTIPEVHGAARAWEVTGEQRWRDIVDAYWRAAVIERGSYCTGSQTCGEIWSPPNELAARLGDKNQEHCVVYNMMRLADFLIRWTGDVSYADYWERNLYNGILAQQHPDTGMVAYFLPLHGGAVKRWGSPTEDFWCCHGTLVQAHTIHNQGVYYADDAGLVICQYVPTLARWQWNGADVSVKQTFDPQYGSTRRPPNTVIDIEIACSQPSEFTLKLRLPWWVDGAATITVNGEAQQVAAGGARYHNIRRIWGNDKLRVILPKRLTTVALPDAPEMVAFMDGPVVLAGLLDEERTLYGDASQPQTMLAPDNEREWTVWQSGYRSVGQPRNFRLIPLHEVREQRYTVYFPVQARV
jgi:DUF1680 family protein